MLAMGRRPAAETSEVDSCTIASRIVSTAGSSPGTAIGALYLIAVLNGFAPEIVNSVRSQTLWSALNSTFGLSVVSVGAVACGLMLARRSPPRQIGTGDMAVAGLVSLLVLLPPRATSWAAVTLLAVYQLVHARSGPSGRSAAAIFLALAASEFWVPVVLRASATLWLAWDAALVATLLRIVGAEEVVQAGNLVSVADGNAIAIIAGCASLPNAAFALLCWLVVAKGFHPAWHGSDIVAVAILGCSVVALNVGRMALMTLDAEDYALIHGALGADVFNLLLLAVSALVALGTVRRNSGPVGSRRGAAGIG